MSRQGIQAATQSGQPILILKEGSSRERGRSAQRRNLTAAKLVSEIVRSSLGPRGMDKMLVDTLGDVTVTNDGATMLKKMDIEHPAAKMMVEIAKAQDNEVGDGTTSVVVLAGTLLDKAEELIDKDVHPSLIVDGYRQAAEKALQVYDEIAIDVDPTDREWLEKVANVSMGSKLVAAERDFLATIATDAILAVKEEHDGELTVDVDDVKVETKTGGSLRDTTLVEGLVLDKEIVHSGMPRRVNDAKIALINSALEVEKTEFDAKINIESPEQMKMFLEEESNMLREMVDKIEESGANIVLCQKGIDDVAQHFLSKRGILAVRRVKKSDMEKLEKATGGRIVTNIEDLSSEDLGEAGTVRESKIEDDRMLFVEECKNPRSVTVLVRGGSERVLDEAERSIHDALSVVKDVVLKPRVVAGGGAPETQVAMVIRDWASSLSGRQQLAATTFADALESIPLALAENAGLDVIDIEVELRSKHRDGETWWGVDVLQGDLGDMLEADIVEPVSVKEQIVKSATEAASMILRIDDVIASKGEAPEMPEGGPGGPGGPGGMGGMPPGAMG